MELSESSSFHGKLWDGVLEITKLAQQTGTDPSSWAIQVSSFLASSGVPLPSFELANFLVSYVFWDNNVPMAWKFLDKALVLKIVPPLPLLALLSTRVIPHRHSCPVAYRLYMELVKIHAFAFKCHHLSVPHCQKLWDSRSKNLHFFQLFDLKANEPGVILIEIIYSIVWKLLDATLDDEGLMQHTSEKKSDMEMDYCDIDNPTGNLKLEHREKMRDSNSVMAIELISEFLQNKVTSRVLYLARENIPVHWRSFSQRIKLLVSHSAALRNSKGLTPEALLKCVSEKDKILLRRHRICSPKQLLGASHRSLAYGPDLGVGLSRTSLWLPLDLVLEDAMDNSQVNATSAVETLTGLVKALQAINGSTWHETFLGLWKAALHLVQRERDPIEGPVPRLDTRFCVLFSITTLVVADLIEEEESAPSDEIDSDLPGNRRMDLVSSLQNLGDYEMLLTPTHSVIPAANQAAAKAMMFVSGINVGSSYFESISMTDVPINCSGNLRHLIVEACIERNLLDTSAYFWPGYVNGSINQLPHHVPSQIPSWSSFMKGASLSPALISALVSAPASRYEMPFYGFDESLAELEKIFEVAVQGSIDDKIAAASILCGASLIRGWNIQEHTVYFITRLLSPSIPADHSGDDSHLIGFAPMLNVLIVGISPVDCVQIFSLHGLVPQLACSLMTICEIFGSYIPNISWNLPSGEEVSAHAVFSNAFALLLKLWRFNHPPIEYGVGDVPPVGSQLTPEYLLLVRNSLLVSSRSSLNDPNRKRLAAVANASNPNPIFVDSFPKLKVWYRQHLACIASPLSGLVHGTPVHHTVDELLSMMFRKVSRNSQPVTSINSGSSSSSGPGSEDAYPRPVLPAWDILEAVPFVVDAALTACAHGILSPRELCTGLKDLADYLPASLATIVSYFSAEVTRGIWKPVLMNGTDWPSPATNLVYVEEQIKKILAATGVDVPSLSAGGNSPAALPLPLAAFVSLTITYKLDKASQRFLNLAGPALESLAAGCPWPCMAIVASLWTQKAKRWSDFLIFSASRTVFLHNNDAVVQLLKSCFNATLGLNTISITSNGGVGSLLGHGFGSHIYGGISPVAPGILYLRVYRSIRDIMFLKEAFVDILMQSVKDIAFSGLSEESSGKLRNPRNGKYARGSLATTMTRVKLAASLGASLAWLTGGLALVQSLIKETLPSWFLSVHSSDHELESRMCVPTLQGYALAYLTVFCVAHGWGLETTSSATRRHPKVLGCHLEFLARVLEGRISVGCHPATWRAYASGFLSLMVDCFPTWMFEVDAKLLKRMSEGLRKWNEHELALAVLGVGGVGTMGAAAEMILNTDFL